MRSRSLEMMCKRTLGALAVLVAGTFSGFAQDGVPTLDEIHENTPRSITGNPAAENVMPGTGLAGQLLRLPEESGLRLGGLWLADSNVLMSGGADPGSWSWNSALIVGANLDAAKLVGWQGASFGVQFLQFNGEDTNGEAGSVQGYNSLPGPPPLNRSELYQFWYRQSLFEDKVIFRVGKLVPTFDFNNVARPVPTQDEALAIPAVTGLLYTPVFVNPTLLGAIGGYYNSVYGLTLTLSPTKNTYLSYGIYDGAIMRGIQTGITGPRFGGYWFNIWEGGVDWVIADQYPGQLGLGGWYQTGTIQTPNATQNGVGGFYMFGSQRIWTNQIPREPAGKAVVETQPKHAPASISTFVQVGVNNADVLPVNEYFGMGVTGYGLVPGRPADSLGGGVACSWLNEKIFARSSEVMLQGYYQAHLIGGTFFQPAISYIPNPGAGKNLDSAWAATFRVTVLF